MNAACTINVNDDLGEPQPLLIHPGTTEWFDPQVTSYVDNGDAVILMNQCETIELVCTTGFASPQGIAGNSIIVACAGDDKFWYEDKFYSFNTFSCNDYPTHVARRIAGRCIYGGTLVEVGFDIRTRFFHLYEVCLNENTDETYYTQDRITPVNVGYQRGKIIKKIYIKICHL